MKTNDEIVDRTAYLLGFQGWSNVRSGEHRSVDAARKLLKAGAKQAELEIKTVSKKGYVVATVK